MDGKGGKGGSSCYHIWIIADGENAAFRRRRCFTQTAAYAALRRWAKYGPRDGDRPGNLLAGADAIKSQTMVLRCRPRCPCGCYREAE